MDLPGQDSTVVRRSRALGLPEPLPDIHGLAVRVVSEQGSGDLLFASTGWGRVSRFVLTASRDPRTRPLTTLLPYRGDSGPIHLGARATSASSYELSWAGHDGAWHTFAELLLSGERDEDQDISFDPVRRPVAGLQQYPFLVRLREPAYRTARRSRGQHRDETPPTPPRGVHLVQPQSHG